MPLLLLNPRRRFSPKQPICCRWYGARGAARDAPTRSTSTALYLYRLYPSGYIKSFSPPSVFYLRAMPVAGGDLHIKRQPFRYRTMTPSPNTRPNVINIHTPLRSLRRLQMSVYRPGPSSSLIDDDPHHGAFRFPKSCGFAQV